MTRLKVTGMSCGHCEKAVREALEQVPGATGVKVDLTAGTATVEGTAANDALLAAVREAGYEAAPA